MDRASIAERAIDVVPEVEQSLEDIPGWTPGYRTVTIEVNERSPLCTFLGKDVAANEQYRMVRTHLLQLPSRPRCVVISSASSGDGKTVTAINLAGTMAVKSDERVLLIDADLRKPGLSKMLGLDKEYGLADVLEGRVSLQDAIVSIEQMPSLYVLPSGTSAAHPAELLESGAWADAIDALRREFSSIIIDTTPVTAVTDFKLVQQVADGVLLVVRPDHTRRSALKQALDKEAGAKVLGVVVNSYQENFLWNSRRD
jgi:protein-tyrosine kinase